jgi:hypothetical protein
MQIVRTIVWIALLIAFVALTVLNWDITLAMRIWPGMVWDTRLPAIVVVSFLLGLIPMWLIHRGSKWRQQRRIAALEGAARSNAVSPSAPVPAPGPLAAEPVAVEPAPVDTPVEGAPVPRDDILR